MPWQSNLPRVAIHDIAIQEQDNEIVLGTHGRSIFVAKLDFVQNYLNLNNKNLQLFSIDDVFFHKNWGSKYASYAKTQQPNIEINYFTSNKENITISILNEKKKLLQQFTKIAEKGMNTFNYNAIISSENLKNSKNAIKADDDNYYLPIGKYFVEIRNNNENYDIQKLIVKEKKKDDKMETHEKEHEIEIQ